MTGFNHRQSEHALNAYSASDEFSRVSYNDIVVRSFCETRPETGLPCPLFKKPKDNSICYRCTAKFGISTKMSMSQIMDMCSKAEYYNDNKLNEHLPGFRRGRKPYYSPNKGGIYSPNRPLRQCEWPNGCSEMTRNQYCHNHMRLLSGRKTRGITDYEKLFAEPSKRHVKSGKSSWKKKHEVANK